MAKESTQKKLSRVRPPRVQITYDVEIGDAIETKELPFVLGVLGDYSGHSKEPLPKMKERKFVQIDRDNFDEVLKGMAPRLAIKVDNKLKDDGSQLAMELNFEELADFEPQNVVGQ
ncbi:type VI secretion system contractile sheath small subunit, partial [Chromobacterium haemolyticum]